MQALNESDNEQIEHIKQKHGIRDDENRHNLVCTHYVKFILEGEKNNFNNRLYNMLIISAAAGCIQTLATMCMFSNRSLKKKITHAD